MKRYKIDPLGKNRPLMLVRGTRLPESFPDSVAEHMAKSLKANCRGVFATINGEISSSTVSPGVVMSKEANEDNNTLVVMTEGMQDESVEWEDSTSKQFRLEHAGRFAGSQYGGHDKYYTGAHKDLRTFVTGAVPYTGQPLVAANAKQWYSYTTPEGVALTFRGCIQAPVKGGTGFVGLKIDSIKYVSGSDPATNFELTLDCDSAISLGLRNGMNDNSKPFNMRPGIGWLQIVATDDFKSHLQMFNEAIGNGDATIDPYEAYDGFTYNVNLRAITTQPGGWVRAGNHASFRIMVKSGSALENSIIANASGFACESFGVDMSGSGDTFPMVEEVSTALSAEPTVINLTTANRKDIVVVRFSSVQEGEQLHLDLSDTVTAPGVINFRSMNTARLATESLGAGGKNFVIDIPRGEDVFAFFGVNYDAAGTLTISRTEQSEPVEPTRTPGFYSSDGQLIKAMTKEEVEQGYSYDNYPANVNEAVKNATNFVWPEGVTSIGNRVFGSCSGLTSVAIPEGVTSIDNAAFEGCTGLTSVTIPDTVTSIGQGAFEGCTGLTSVTIPEGVTSIGNAAFQSCSSLTSVTIPSTVTSIRNNTFHGCTGLTSVTIPSTVTSIGRWAFNDCTGLNPLVVPNTVTTIGDDAFKNVPKVIYGGTATGTPWGALEVVAPQRTPGFYSADGQLIKAMTKEEVETDYTNDNYPSKVNGAVMYATEFVWPEGVTKVGNTAFGSCSDLTSVTIPEGVTSIGNFAFIGCSGLTSVTIPEGVTSIGQGAFNGCTGLTSVALPNTLTTIGPHSFSGCSGLTSVTIPSTVTSIGSHAFEGCTGLTSVAIPEGVTSIGESTFENCSHLTSVTIPSTVTRIGNWAFKDCTSLNPLVVPNTVTSIGMDAFKNVPKVIYGGQATGTPWGALEVVAPKPTPGFYSSDGQLIKAMTKEEVEQDYTYPNNPADANVAIKNATKFVWPDGVTKVGNNTFYDCSKLTSVTIPNTVTSIGNGAFGSCSGLTSVSIPSTVTSMGNSAFSGCSGLTSVTIPEGVTSIGNSVFSGCSGLTSVTIPNTVTSIGSFAFKKCSALNPLVVPNGVATIGSDAFKNVPKVIYGGTATGTPWGALEVVAPKPAPGFYNVSNKLIKAMTKEEVETDYSKDNCPTATTQEVRIATKFVWPDGVTRVGANVFEGCTMLESVTIPEGVTSIGNDAFSLCMGLKSVTIPSTVTSIGTNAFTSCTGLTSVTIPEGVTSIGNTAFSGCSGLTSVTLPNTLTTIGDSVFNNCSGLTSVTIPDGVTSIGNSAFEGCKGLTSVTLPNTLTSIGSRAFDGCTSLTSVAIPEGVTSIGNSAFSRCSGLTSVTIPNTVTTIESSAFSDCTGLTEVTISEGVTTINRWAFGGCTGLNPLVVPNTVTTIGTNAFNNVPKVIYGGTATGTPWGAKEVVAPGPEPGPDPTPDPGPGPEPEPDPEPTKDPGFYSADGQLVKAMTKEEVEQDYVYSACPSATTQTIKNATKFVWPEGVTKVGNNAFYECKGLTSLDIPSTVTSIGNSAFDSCSGLTSLDIPSTVTSIGNGAFSKCSGLTSVSIPSTVTSIGNSVFGYCTRLASVTIPEGVTSIGSSAFSGCSALTSVTIPNTVTSIGQWAFKKCSALNPLTVPNTVTTIGKDAFKDVPKVIYSGSASGSPWGATEVAAS